MFFRNPNLFRYKFDISHRKQTSIEMIFQKKVGDYLDIAKDEIFDD
jgi:hypothetical protein